jgi:Hemerythrin HHE cation binding domain
MASHDTDDVVDVVLEDHQRIRELFSEFEAAKPDQRTPLWETIVRTLAVHETAEEEIVHPQVRRDVDGGSDIVAARRREEDAAKKALARLEKIGANEPSFEPEFTAFRHDVLRHADREEHDELPQLRASVAIEKRKNLASVFSAAKAMAPTHAHKAAPESAVGNVIIGPFVATTGYETSFATRCANERRSYPG